MIEPEDRSPVGRMRRGKALKCRHGSDKVGRDRLWFVAFLRDGAGDPFSGLDQRKPLAVDRNLIAEECSLREAVSAINIGPAHVALVVARDGQLLGIVTDGDVRRALLSGQGLDDPVRQAMPSEFHSLPASATASDALKVMRTNSLDQVPVIDPSGQVTGIYVIDALAAPESLPNTVVIMAGGEGLRLRPLTNDTPKTLLPVGGRPILEIIINQCAEAGFYNFVISVNHLKDRIKSFAGDGSQFGVNITYVEEDEPSGTAGSLSLLKGLGDEPMIVMNGDVLTRVNFRDLLRSHLQVGAHATVCARRHETPVPFGILHMEGVDIVAIDEKPVFSHLVNAGIYVLQSSVVDLIHPGMYLDMTELLKLALKRGRRVCAFPLHEYWLDIGLPETLMQADSEWLSRSTPGPQ